MLARQDRQHCQHGQGLQSQRIFATAARSRMAPRQPSLPPLNSATAVGFALESEFELVTAGGIPPSEMSHALCCDSLVLRLQTRIAEVENSRGYSVSYCHVTTTHVDMLHQTYMAFSNTSRERDASARVCLCTGKCTEFFTA